MLHFGHCKRPPRHYKHGNKLTDEEDLPLSTGKQEILISLLIANESILSSDLHSHGLSISPASQRGVRAFQMA
jgi:hypothetical protein